MYIRLVPKIKFIITGGKWKSFAHWFHICFYFFPDTYVSLLIFYQRFFKEREGPFGEKNRFWCLIPQKNCLEKCRLKVKLVFKNIDFCGSYEVEVPKNRHFEQIWGFRAFFGTFWSITSTKINIFKNRFHFQSTFFKAVLLRYQT